MTQTERLARFYNRYARGPISADELRRQQAKTEVLIDQNTLRISADHSKILTGGLRP